MNQDLHPLAPVSDSHKTVQPEYQAILNELNKEVHHAQPLDLLQFCSDFFLQKLRDERERTRNPFINQQDGMMPLSHDDDIDEEEEEDTIAGLPHIPLAPGFSGGRRTSVSAESMQPPTNSHDFQKKVIPKDDGQREKIRLALKDNFLFKNLDDEQYLDVVNAMEERHVEQGEKVIEQGAEGDFFYVVKSGTFDCFVNDKKVTDYAPGGSFGELALMYSAPRAASIIATSPAVLWALDRMSFRTMVMESTSRKRTTYSRFLAGVPLLTSLDEKDRNKIADALEAEVFESGETVMKEGDMGEKFYMIEDGEAVCYKGGVVVNRLQTGAYFGELALLNEAPRAATVEANGRLKCVTLTKRAFDRLLGPVKDILSRNSANYSAILQQAGQAQ